MIDWENVGTGVKGIGKHAAGESTSGKGLASGGKPAVVEAMCGVVEAVSTKVVTLT